MAHRQHTTPPLPCLWKSPDAAVCCLKTASSIMPTTKRQLKAWGIKSQSNLEFLNVWHPVADFCLLYISSSHYLQRSSGITFLCSASPEAPERKEKRTEFSVFPLTEIPLLLTGCMAAEGCSLLFDKKRQE